MGYLVSPLPYEAISIMPRYHYTRKLFAPSWLSMPSSTWATLLAGECMALGWVTVYIPSDLQAPPHPSCCHTPSYNEQLAPSQCQYICCTDPCNTGPLWCCSSGVLFTPGTYYHTE
jgi:hypothetical protein